MEPAVQEPARRRKVRWGRVALWGCIGVIVLGLVAGGGFYLWFRAQVGAANSRVDPGVIQALSEKPTTTSSPGSTAAAAATTTSIRDPSGMNILLIGSDKRASTGAGGRSDSIILVHIDPGKNFLSMLSVPRDLRVEIPGHGMNKINVAYRVGGPALLIRTIRSVLGVDLDHYMEVDFKAFKQITDTLGGVYVDIDRKYDDLSIQFDPGYQLLDGTHALDYVRTRHDSNFDFGRMERQQRFIAAVREQAMGWNLPLKLPSLIKALFSNIDTDLSANEFLKLAYWGVKLDGGRMRLAKLTAPVQVIDSTSFLVATPEQIQSAVKDFSTEPDPVVEPEDVAAPPNAQLKTADLDDVVVNVINGTGRPGQGALAAVWVLRQGAQVSTIKEAPDPVAEGAIVTYPRGQAEEAKAVALALGIPRTRQSSASSLITVTLGKDYGVSGEQIPVATAGSGTAADAAKWRTLAGTADFPIMAPDFLPNNCVYSFQREYDIKVGGGTKPAVRVGYQYRDADKYLGISETTWLDAPIASPGWKVKGPGGVIYTVVGSSTKSDHVWWKQDGVLHWVTNTLVFDLRREEMLAAAMSALPVPEPPVTTSTVPGSSTSVTSAPEGPTTTNGPAPGAEGTTSTLP
jgi:polyisoprenyl-teichoic acid--peptidoglycan teichoic acid transferase